MSMRIRLVFQRIFRKREKLCLIAAACAVLLFLYALMPVEDNILPASAESKNCRIAFLISDDISPETVLACLTEFSGENEKTLVFFNSIGSNAPAILSAIVEAGHTPAVWYPATEGNGKTALMRCIARNNEAFFALRGYYPKYAYSVREDVEIREVLYDFAVAQYVPSAYETQLPENGDIVLLRLSAAFSDVAQYLRKAKEKGVQCIGFVQ